jgi:hypothetical protein
VINADAMVKMGLVSVEVRMEGSKCEGNPDGEQLMVDISTSTRIPNTKDPSVKVESTHDIFADDAALEPHRSGVVLFVSRFHLLMIAFVTFAFVQNRLFL